MENNNVQQESNITCERILSQDSPRNRNGRSKSIRELGDLEKQ